MLTSSLPFADIVDNFKDIGTQTGFSGPQFLAQCVGFLIVCGLLYKFAWKPVLQVLDARQKAIADSIANVEKIKGELAEAETSRHQILQKASEQANQIVAEAKQSAAALSEKLAKEAQAQAQDIIRKGNEAATADRARIFAELKQEVGALVIQTTEKVTGKVLTPDDQSRLNTETLRELSAVQN